MSLQEDVIHAFRDRFGREPELVVRAPGRVNLLGEHVDYSEGWVLPAAIEQTIWLAVAGADDNTTTIRALDFGGEEGRFSASDLAERDASRPVSWIDYPRGVAWTLRHAGQDVAPVDAVYAGNVPVGAGLSSSAAVEVAFLLAWNWLGRLEFSSQQLAKLGQQTENRYIGLASGIMDQFASIHGAYGQLVLLDCRTLEHELVPLPPNCAILVADSGVRRELASSEYNVRRSQCEEAVDRLRAYLPAIRTLRDVTPEEFEVHAHHLPILVRRRAQHVVEECQRVLAGADMLKNGDVAAFGRLIRKSHVSLRDLYEVSIPELDVLAATAWQVEGCYGARLTGAGFGGCVVVLAKAEASERIAGALCQAYQETFSRTPQIFHTRAAAGATATAT